MSLNLNHRGGRGTLRERHIGEGKLRELMAKASKLENDRDLLGAAPVWKQALDFINYGKPGARAKEFYINKRLAYCCKWGPIIKASSNN